MSADTEYNGWKNYPTWAVNLWLGNEEHLYRCALELARGSVTVAPVLPQVLDEIWTVEQAARFNLADVLKSWVENDLAPDLGATFASDLLGWALESVDWHEIADAWLEQVEPVTAA